MKERKNGLGSIGTVAGLVWIVAKKEEGKRRKHQVKNKKKMGRKVNHIMNTTSACERNWENGR